MKKYVRSIIFSLMLPLLSCGVVPKDYVNIPMKDEAKHTFIKEGFAMALNQIILAKRDTKICAIKFKTLQRTDTGKTLLNEFRQQLLEWDRYDLVGNTYKLTAKGTDSINGGPMAGYGHSFSYQKNGKNTINCGGFFEIHAEFNSRIMFNYDSLKNDKYNVELFPTDWTDFSKVDLSSPDIKWIKFVERCRETPYAFTFIDCPTN